MSKYTTQLRYIVETKAGKTESVGYDTIDSMLTSNVLSQIFPSFPIFDENYRLPLEKKIIKHYYTREICEETFGLWRLRLDSKLNEIMPYYNQLYLSEALAIGYDPFSPVNISRTHVLDRKSKTTNAGINSFDNQAHSESDDASRDLYSDTPQGALTGVESGNYLTNARKVTVDSETDSNASGNSISNAEENFENTDQFVESLIGTYGYRSNADELSKFRDTFLNIDMMVIEELKDLFFGLW